MRVDSGIWWIAFHYGGGAVDVSDALSTTSTSVGWCSLLSFYRDKFIYT